MFKAFPIRENETRVKDTISARSYPLAPPAYHRNNEAYVCNTTTRVKDTISARSYPLAPPPYHRNNEVYVCNTTTRVKDTISTRSYPLVHGPRSVKHKQSDGLTKWLSHRSRDTNKALNCITRSRDTNTSWASVCQPQTK